MTEDEWQRMMNAHETESEMLMSVLSELYVRAFGVEDGDDHYFDVDLDVDFDRKATGLMVYYGEVQRFPDGRYRWAEEGGGPLPTNFVSPHFSWTEMTRSRTAERLGIENTPTPPHRSNLRTLCANVLEPVRELVNASDAITPSDRERGVKVNSGYRCAELNDAIGGSTSSQHMTGEAADIEVDGVPNGLLASLIRSSGIPFDQLILEFHNPEVPSSGWIHISHNAHRAQRGQVLTATKVVKDGKRRTVYKQGLPGDE